MALLDASLVSQALVKLLLNGVTASPEFAKVANLNVSPLSPDRLSGDSTLGMYLYYVEENAQYKNPPAAVAGSNFPDRFSPMGLNFYYQLTAYSDLDGDGAAVQEQLLIGLAMKILRDNPLIDDSTQVNGVTIFPQDLQGDDNFLRITLQPVPFTEAMNYWNAGDRPLRLAVYYQVTPVLLRPDRPDSLRGRVLTYGVFSFPRGAPRLDASQNVVTFTVSGETTPRQIQIQPAEVAVGGTLTLFGSDLAGDRTTLLLNNRRFAAPIEVAADWAVTASATGITAVVQPQAKGTIVLPGVYSARASVAMQRRLPDGTMRSFVNNSNEIPFLVVPAITAISPPSGNGTITITGGVFQDPAIPADAVQLFLGSTLVTRHTGGGVLNQGEFETVNPTTLNFRFPATGFVTGTAVPFRLIINGAENAPTWVQVP